jgi:hypothetical protein
LYICFLHFLLLLLSHLTQRNALSTTTTNNNIIIITNKVYTFLLAVLSEWGGTNTIRIQNVLSRSQRIKKYKYVRKCIMTLLYGLQQFLGWGLMLISMTFSIELFISVIFGLFVGKLLFSPPTGPATTMATTTRNTNRIRSTRIVDDGHNEENNNNNNNDITAPLLLSQSEEEESSNGSSTAIRRRRR